MATATGHCLCGAIQLELLDGMPDSCILCHCTNCRQQSGGLGVVGMLMPRARVRITGEDHLASYRDAKCASGSALVRLFCETCGSNIGAAPEKSPETLAVRGGLFPSGSLPPPKFEIFTMHQERWEQPHDGAKQCERGLSR
ncbi:GFA family protein [Rhodotorula paludigena]|uniref:GFA family protein n=1 Tax=Rhodotorula paludigena TaxID=86838 RepID=UPI0031781FCF